MIEAGELTSVRGRRDQILLLFGWMMMALRSEFVAIQHRDIAVTADGLDSCSRRDGTCSGFDHGLGGVGLVTEWMVTAVVRPAFYSY